MTAPTNAKGSKNKSFSLSLFFRKLYRDPYETLDNLDLKVFGLQFNIMKDDQKLLRAIKGPLFLAPLLAWIFTAFIMLWKTPFNGVDAGLNQLSHPLTTLIMGEGIDKAVGYFFSEYGKGCHWTAFIIYYGFFYGLSKHFRKIGLTNSINISFTTCFTALTIACFEYSWMLSYSLFQGQHWILSFGAPQTMIMIQNLVFLMLGVLRIGNINWKVLKPNFNKWTGTLLSITLGVFILWEFYGLVLPVQQITVLTGIGPWTSSIRFPQTVYTIALSPESSINYNTIAVWVHNDLLHLVNTLAKVFMTLTLLNVFKLEERKIEQE